MLLSCAGYFGTLLTYVVGIFLPWRTLATVLGALAAPYVAGMLLVVPESPQYYLRDGLDPDTELRDI